MKKFAIVNRIYQNYVIVYFRSLRLSCTTMPLRPANRKREFKFFNQSLRAFLHGDGGPQVGEVTRLSI